MNRHDLAAWLLRNGFAEVAKRGTGHAQFIHAATGVKVTLPGHGPKELTRATTGNVVREIERAGFDRRELRRELGYS